MGGKKKRAPKPVVTCPCGHEITESGLCLVDGPDGQTHEVPPELLAVLVASLLMKAVAGD